MTTAHVLIEWACLQQDGVGKSKHPEGVRNLDHKLAITGGMTPIDGIADADVEYVDEVVQLAARAKAYLESMPWCKRILDGWLDYSCGHIIGIFYFHILPGRPRTPRFVWVIVGDLPPAYMDGEFHRSGPDALDAYVSEMQEWVNRVRSGRELDDDVIDVNVPPEKEWADLLQTRLVMIREMFLDARPADAERRD